MPRPAAPILVAFFTVAILAGSSAAPLDARELHVSPDGTPEGEATAEDPLDLATVLGPESPAAPGDTMVLADGTYRGRFASQIRGTADAPIVVRPREGARAVIDGAGHRGAGLSILGPWTVWRGLEVLCSDPDREADHRGPLPLQYARPTGILIGTSHTRVIHCRVHDCGHGIRVRIDAEHATVYGCLVYNNGWLGPLRGHGSGIQTHNERGTDRIEENLVFNQFGYGIEIASAAGALHSYLLRGNVCFGSGSPPGGSEPAANLFLGSHHRAARNIELADNHFYQAQLQRSTGTSAPPATVSSGSRA